MLTIYVDADACPVKEEVYQIARHYGMHLRVVANTALRVPTNSRIELIVRSALLPRHARSGKMPV